MGRESGMFQHDTLASNCEGRANRRGRRLDSGRRRAGVAHAYSESKTESDSQTNAIVSPLVFSFFLEKRIDNGLVAALKLQGTKINRSIAVFRVCEKGATRGVAEDLEAKS
jgi:hypothetical protein